MSELVTLSKKDPLFVSYINGTFSKDLRALPIQSLNVNTDSEQVTFRVLPRNEISPPFLGLHWLQILKVRYLLFIAFPVLLIFIKNLQDSTLRDPVTGVLSALGAFFLMTAMNLRNDYLDHVSGLDRLHPNSRSHAIQKGWVTAGQVRRWSYVYLILGSLFGLPALWLYPKIIFLVGALAILGIFGMTSFHMGLKYRRWSEWSAFLLLGPLLTIGVQFSVGNGFDFQSAWIGCLTGGLSVFYLHLKNFEQLMVNNQAQFQNTMTWLGFERGKSWLMIWWTLFLVGLVSFQTSQASLFWQIVILTGSLFVTIPFGKSIRNLKSPLGSQMKTLIRLGHLAVLFMMGLWMLQALWTLWLAQ